jgi:hypothetical protein
MEEVNLSGFQVVGIRWLMDLWIGPDRTLYHAMVY